ncbi:hypothetical protein Avbf_03565 [Armadillidium vulgare]|nr:hypothetical protein Avbf_03565 [Armadillidium vulgare]
MKDRRGIERGRCNESMCPCTEYEVDAGAILCSYCGHVPLQHTELTVLMKPSNIMDNPRQENNSLEEILNGTSSVSVNMNSNLPSSSNHGACKSSHIVTENQFSESALEISEPTLESSEQIVSEVSSMDSNQLTLPNFSDFVIPYLQGENLCSKLKNTMRNIIIETLIEFLDKNNMLTGKSKIQQALGYKALGRRLLLKYPKIHREDCTSKRRRKEELVSVTGFLISRLADRRRVRKNRERQKEKQSPFFKNSEEALSFLHDFKLENFKTMDKLVEALYMTKDTRSNYALETIPEYLLHSKAVGSNFIN